ncbi:phosphodiester glycosidase family protein [Roseovarius sp. SYSU LYC5161]|uniref:phosphodiester glycosidase family protein n=1 Tax=Roseovarius halophilus (ex Wu et al. 2025) TaxID=3376060 RepID=UPI00399B3C34
MWRGSAALAGLCCIFATTGPATAVECRVTTHTGHDFTICEVVPPRDDLRLFLRHPETDKVLGTFTNVEAMLERPLLFGMNAGMYHSDRRPVGHYVENGRTLSPVISRDGPGNFGLLPNGVFCIRENSARVIETRRFTADSPECDFATQSGPMLVINGQLHPRFLPDSDSRYIRNGVGTTADGRRAVFAISETPVTFHVFGTLFRDVLETPQALYLDGNISRLYAPRLGRRDGGFPMGPIVGVVSADE